MPSADRVRFAVVGVEHPHAANLASGLLAAGAECAGFHNRAGESDGAVARAFAAAFPQVTEVDDPRRLLDDPSISLIVTADVPDRRAAVAVAALHSGKDVLAAKPGCVSLDELAAIRQAVADTGRFWWVCFSERLHVRSVVRASQVVAEGRIGRVVQTIGLGPHRLSAPTRPEWFFDQARGGGILTDLASHQVDQFLHFTGSTQAEVVASTVANHANPGRPRFADFGELLLRGDAGHGYARVDWYTPDGLPTWGDGRLTVLGTDGYLEIRKYVDVAGVPGGDHLFVVDGAQTERVDCTDVELPFYPDLVRDITDRTERAMTQSHSFLATELAIRADLLATRAGHLA
ncbi:MAG: Gfo/Idh/MocA family oxidoreductase [Hamadaea sp.]|uniref:Gfo/Idh/MocA family protein n=1 Tax=Hamadaea sp. TaxID=2024425 RepID=UPI001855CA5B|nr:Gfo/Idh/MocA family oxidoreductase [Hamadaea sp.]NUR73836.1 Gfo/Idh/MocA family oxidoreductase [Hamadaea sp.]NUT18999.1 Gfo/Idh/MocA family oxidoreductase [Hamadaea sp.]